MDQFNYNACSFPPLHHAGHFGFDAHPQFGLIPATGNPIAQLYSFIPQNHGFIPSLAQAGYDQQPPYPGYYAPQAPVQPPPNHTIPPIPVPQQYNLLDRQIGWDAAIADVVFHRQHVLTESQHTSDPIRTKKSRSRHILPPSTERVNAEAGPSTPPGQIPPVDKPTTQQSGGSSETAADAASTQSNKEENKTPKPKKARAPKGKGKVRPYRVRMQRDETFIRGWFQKKKGLPRTPSLRDALAGALEVIEMIHGAVNEEPVLFETGRSKNGVASEPAELERGRRGVHRGLYRKLSKYYPRTKGLWTQPGLLKKVVEDLENHVALRQSPEAST